VAALGLDLRRVSRRQTEPIGGLVGGMFKVILRSTCVGIASIVLAAFASFFIAIAFAIVDLWRIPQQPSEPEVGWDLITAWHGNPAVAKLIPVVAVAAFAIGFLIGFRHFSKSLSRP
jgi:hypothetical protein